jgi:hypothetical protein
MEIGVEKEIGDGTGRLATRASEAKPRLALPESIASQNPILET